MSLNEIKKYPTLPVSFGALLSSTAFFTSLPLVALLYINLPVGHFTRHLGTSGAGIAVGVSFLIAALLAPLWGTLSARYGPRSMMLRAGSLLAATYIVIAIAPNTDILLLGRILNGFASGYMPAAALYIASNSFDQTKGRELSFFSMARSSGAILGPSLGALLVPLTGYSAAFLVAACIAIGATLIAALAPSSTAAAKPSTESITKGTAEPTPSEKHPNHRADHKYLFLAFILLLGLSGAMTQNTVPFSLLDATSSNEIAALGTGIIFMVTGTVGLVVAYPWGRLIDKMGIERLMPIAIAISIIPAAGLLFFSAPLLQGICYVVLVTVLAELSTMLYIAIPPLVAQNTAGMLYGFFTTAQNIAAAAAPVAASFISLSYNPKLSFLIAVLLQASLIPLSLRIVSQYRGAVSR